VEVVAELLQDVHVVADCVTIAISLGHAVGCGQATHLAPVEGLAVVFELDPTTVGGLDLVVVLAQVAALGSSACELTDAYLGDPRLATQRTQALTIAVAKALSVCGATIFYRIDAAAINAASRLFCASKRPSSSKGIRRPRAIRLHQGRIRHSIVPLVHRLVKLIRCALIQVSASIVSIELFIGPLHQVAREKEGILESTPLSSICLQLL